ncbi:hypothetical protein FBU59_006483 [Linderina macrospora]|uniref:Uncharacterized protein n=1 Tax=Linderina macrospora TaxID=4868 RepID=A0ACC1IZR8_9FUNG|nr:hypothetical protein FBU59_006483 [Linderina macrospora]
MSSKMQTKRLLRELTRLKQTQCPHISLQSTDSLDTWLIDIKGVDSTLYENESFTLQFKFTREYPIEAPEVTFTGNVPLHPHIYSNGHICLSILYQHWSPVLTVDAICLSILSMLNDVYIKKAGPSPKDTAWIFDDATV